jgi:branched-chain amino acid transport system ATP-binding protein
MATPILALQDVHTYYGNIHALKGISLTVNAGEIVTLIGSNGAGKSTTLRTISGIISPRQGEISFNGTRIDRMPAHEIVRLGVLQSPEGRRIFPRLTVLENLEMGAFTRNDAVTMKEDLERVYTLFPRLRERINQKGGTLSGGEQHMLAIGRGLASSPKLLMLDEPSMGLSPVMADFIFERLIEIRRQTQLTVLLVEQRVAEALETADYGYVLEAGRTVLEGTHDVLSANDRVRQAYLGM